MNSECGKSGKLSVVIPVYNEESTLAELLERVSAVSLPVKRELLIVDDGSRDRSAEIARCFIESHPGLECKLIMRANGGKGAAVRDGIAASTGSVVIIQDADLEYDPNDFKCCIAPILAGDCAVVYGSRVRPPPVLAASQMQADSRAVMTQARMGVAASFSFCTAAKASRRVAFLAVR